MNLQELKFKTRKYWLWLNLVVTVLTTALILILDQYNIDRFWAFLAYVPLIFLGLDANMVLTKQEIKKVIIFFVFLLYILTAWLHYEESHSMLEIFSLETIINFGVLAAFFFIPVLLFGYLPYKILHWKDKKIINTGTYDFREAAYFIYRQLSDGIAQKTSDKEVEAILKIVLGSKYAQLTESFVEKNEGSSERKIDDVLKTYSHFSRKDLDEILILNKQYIDEK
ncbi:MAG: hypothetical protein WAV73_01395 [Candidatus Moraniibacteriota bacterium]